MIEQDLPPIAISVITYNRPNEFRSVMESLFRNLVYPRDKVFLVIGDDGSKPDYVAEWADENEATLASFSGIQITRTKRGGMPVNWNNAIRQAHINHDYVLCLQDDWKLTNFLDIRKAVVFLQENPVYGFMRYHKLSGHVGLVAVIKEWDTRSLGIAFEQTPYEYAPWSMTFWELLPPFDGNNTFSPYSGGVHIRTKAFTDFYGEYATRVKFSNSEMDFMTRVNEALRTDLNRCPRFAMLPHYVPSRFHDISEASYRDTKVEAETVVK